MVCFMSQFSVTMFKYMCTFRRIYFGLNNLVWKSLIFTSLVNNVVLSRALPNWKYLMFWKALHKERHYHIMPPWTSLILPIHFFPQSNYIISTTEYYINLCSCVHLCSKTHVAYRYMDFLLFNIMIRLVNLF